MGRFELLIGEERDGSPVYQQAHSREMPENDKTVLYRWGKWKHVYTFLCIRSQDQWVVEKEGYLTTLKASVRDNHLLQPTTGWKFSNRGNFEEDPTLICILPSTSPPCCLTLTLSGAAKEAHGDCEGEYKSTGMTSMGRKVFKHY